MAGPFHCPWPTIAAVLVVLAACLTAIIWALTVRLED